MAEPRLCPTCKFFWLDLGSEGYSEYTPGYPGDMSCTKGHWSLDTSDTLAYARKAMHTAETCKDYELYVEDANGA